MPEASKSLPASTDHGKIGPDYFGYYTCEIMELLSQDEDFLPYTPRTPELTRKSVGVTAKDMIDEISSGSVSSFSNSIGTGLSDYKKERLKSLLRQGVFNLTSEVDEMLDPVIAMCQLRAQIRTRKCSTSVIGAVSEDDVGKAPHKKLKTSPCSSSASTLNGGSCRQGSVCNCTDSKSLDAALLENEKSNVKKNWFCSHSQKTSQWMTVPEGPQSLCDACRSSGDERDLLSNSNIGADKENGEVDDDLQFLLENDSSQVEETLKKHSDELSATLDYMEQQLEELLNGVVSKCRPMTLTEKQELQKLIQKLPQNNLDRVVELVQDSKLAENQSSNELLVDLEQEDNVTLWRLYYYVKAVEKAKELLV